MGQSRTQLPDCSFPKYKLVTVTLSQTRNERLNSWPSQVRAINYLLVYQKEFTLFHIYQATFLKLFDCKVNSSKVENLGSGAFIFPEAFL